jgi:predicted nucleotidyltransferase
LLALLQEFVPNAEVWAYGSRVNGLSHECSDLDIVIRNPGNIQERSPGIAALRTALQDSVLPFMVDVHDWANLAEDFHRNIEKGYVELQAGRRTGG